MFPFLFDSSQPEELLGRRDVQSSAVDSGSKAFHLDVIAVA